MDVKIYTDGAARGNPDGPGGYGAVLTYMDREGRIYKKEISAGYRKTTNNRMELMAVIRSLQELNRPCRVELYSDSKYVVDAFNQNWIAGWIKKGWKTADGSPVKNADLWKKLYEAAKPHDIEWVWVKGHDGIEGNERADFLANLGVEKTLEQSKKKN